MQIKKEELEQKIILAARQEFLVKGFEKASMRSIASAARTTKGNLYNYFSGKDHLFQLVCQPAIDFLERSMMEEGCSDEACAAMLEENGAELSRKSFSRYAQQLEDYSTELRLLLYASSGSSLSDFREQVFEIYTQSSRRFFRSLSKHYPGLDTGISTMFIHSLASMYLSFIEEMLVHRPEPGRQERYIHQLSTFVHHGVMQVMRDIQKEEQA